MWRAIYFALLFGLWALAATTPYVSSVSGPAIVGAAILPATFYIGVFFFWLFRLWPASPFEHISTSWRGASLRVADRSALFIGSTLFAIWLAPVKATFPKLAGFWADPYLAEFDRMLFGRDPWLITHAWFGPTTTVIDYLYGFWIFVVPTVSLFVALFAGEERLRRYFIGLAVIWTVLGVGAASALASAGPIFGPDLNIGFGELRAALDAHAPYSTMARQQLWHVYETGQLKIGGGISAAPSIHCAMVFLFAFAAYGTRWFVPAILYSAFIWFGSVHLGWHYFADGLLSLIGVALIWFAIVRSGELKLSGLRLARKQASIA